QQQADIVAFELALAGSDLPLGSVTDLDRPPGTSSQDTHSFVGAQVTVSTSPAPPAELARMNAMLAAADAPASRVSVVVKGEQETPIIPRGYAYAGGGT